MSSCLLCTVVIIVLYIHVPAHVHVHVAECVCCAQICQKILKGGGFALGTLSKYNTWFIDSLDPETFQFTINYLGGDEGRCVATAVMGHL